MDRRRLTALLGMLGSDHDGEVANAGRAADRLVRASGTTWEQVVNPPVGATHHHPGYSGQGYAPAYPPAYPGEPPIWWEYPGIWLRRPNIARIWARFLEKLLVLALFVDVLFFIVALFLWQYWAIVYAGFIGLAWFLKSRRFSLFVVFVIPVGIAISLTGIATLMIAVMVSMTHTPSDTVVATPTVYECPTPPYDRLPPKPAPAEAAWRNQNCR